MRRDIPNSDAALEGVAGDFLGVDLPYDHDWHSFARVAAAEYLLTLIIEWKAFGNSLDSEGATCRILNFH